ncbi:MAG: sigma 54-interacting transcriptional regulator [Acidobacteriota bacterium]
MAFRLVCHLSQRSIKSLLEPGENLIGSEPSCTVRLSHPTVSRRHAVIRVTQQGLELEDLGSSNGTRVDSRRIVGATQLSPANSLAFGSVRAQIEEVRAGDLELALPLPESAEVPAGPTVAARSRTTLSASALEDFTLRQLPRLLERLETADVVEMAQAVGAAVFRSFPCLRVEVVRADREAQLFFAQHSDPSDSDSEVIESTAGDLALRVAFFPPAVARIYAPIVEAGGRLIGLASRRRSAVTRPPSGSAPNLEPAPPPLPAPPTIEPKVREIYERAARVALGDVGVVIQGESGTGKEVLARYLHQASGRGDDQFVALNCAALPRDLLELELFGIEKGVATGVDARPGKFELADNGTLFLDEIGDMALESQARILRVLQEREVYRIGGKQPRSAKVRTLAATHFDIDAMVRDGRFRGDLYHRIAGWVPVLPPLRQRVADIPNLAAFFLAREAKKLGLHLAGISQSAMRALVSYRWPGNIRELQREIARAALFLAEGDVLESTHLGSVLGQQLERSEATLKQVLEDVEREHIERALTLAGSVPAAAKRLGIGRSTLYRRMGALGLLEPETP